MSMILKCAVYTRKSTDDGLDQDFNSLDAQREACEAYIRSQASLGWKLIPKKYDDGGVSGGTMERPALQDLLFDIKAKKVDVVVVYKIDRLTRSLIDFSKIVEIFDGSNASFVSVTQQFNTTTSMGRLTLNVLLSFAQFEREVTAERIRDKIAASKKKGMWMGGLVPLGYDLRDRRLYVNNADAETVRLLFRLYLETKSVRTLKVEADRLGIITKERATTNTRSKGGKPFTRGHLYRLLSNRIYLGQIEHRKSFYEGQHDAIVDQSLWEQVQQQLKAGSVYRNRPKNADGTHLLSGLIFDETGDRLSPTYAIKGAKRYRYYTSNRLLQAHRKDMDGWRLPAETLEKAVLRGIIQFLNNPSQYVDISHLDSTTSIDIQSFGRRCTALVRSISEGTSADHRALVQNLISRIDLAPGQIIVLLNKTGSLASLITLANPTGAPDDKVRDPPMLRLPITFKKRGTETKIVVGDHTRELPVPDRSLVKLLAKAQRWLDLLITGSVSTLEDLARTEGADPTDVSRILPLALLAPRLIENILAGSCPPGLTLMKLKRLRNLPLDWLSQDGVVADISVGR
jgi:site-specific DNA recombinase